MLQIVNMIVAVLSDRDPVAEASLIAIAVIVVAWLALALVHAVARQVHPKRTHVLWETRQHLASAATSVVVRQQNSKD
jgi:hypothetical protein